jgi:DNA-binding transcriptional LysR family regulator
MTDELCVILPPKHRLHQRAAVSRDELSAEGFIMAKNECTMQFLRMTGLHVDQNTPLIRYQATDSATILAMVREGLGITVLPRTTLPKRLDGLVALSIDPPQHLEIGLVMKTQDTASPAAKLFVQTIADWMRVPYGLVS